MSRPSRSYGPVICSHKCVASCVRHKGVRYKGVAQRIVYRYSPKTELSESLDYRQRDAQQNSECVSIRHRFARRFYACYDES